MEVNLSRTCIAINFYLITTDHLDVDKQSSRKQFVTEPTGERETSTAHFLGHIT